MLQQQLVSNWQKIPGAVKSFLGRALALLIGWQLLYMLYLQPTRLFDAFLTRLTGVATEKVLQLLYAGRAFDTTHLSTTTELAGTVSQTGSAWVWMGEQPLISIADPCNGLNMYALFLGFVIAYPVGVVLKLAFGTLGLTTLIGVNLARCVGLAVLQIYYPDFTVFAHHYIFNVLTYAAVFGLWYWFTKKAVL
jgi:exosortase/archaeosortase family protein